jgi:CO/xanthine dehydrogenase FAD-binding subunit
MRPKQKEKGDDIMLLTLPDFDYFSCKTIEEACSLLATQKGEARVLAGGTDVLVKMKHRKMTPRSLVNIKKVPGLDYIRYDEAQGLTLGALTTMQAIRNSSIVMKKFSSLGEAAGVLGTPHVRNLATLGGNLCNASPAAECAPALLTLGAKAKIASLRGERVIPLENFFCGPGKSILEEDEILTEIQIPSLPPRTAGLHLKYGSRRVDIAVVGVSVLMTVDDGHCQDVKIALSAAGPTPFRVKKAESILRGEMLDGVKEGLVEKVAQMASEESSPIDDIRGHAEYRRHLVKVLVADGIERLISQMIYQSPGSRGPVVKLN